MRTTNLKNDRLAGVMARRGYTRTYAQASYVEFQNMDCDKDYVQVVVTDSAGYRVTTRDTKRDFAAYKDLIVWLALNF